MQITLPLVDMVELHEVYSGFNGCKVGDCGVALVGAVKTAVFGYLRQQICAVVKFSLVGLPWKKFSPQSSVEMVALCIFCMGKSYRFGMVGTPFLSHLNLIVDMWVLSLVNPLYGQNLQSGVIYLCFP